MRQLFILMVGILLIVFFTMSYKALQNIRVDYQIKQDKSPSIQIPPVFLKMIAGEFKGLVADYALIEAASIVGKSEKITEKEWDTVGHLYKQTMALDPYFEQSYHLIQGSLPWYTKKYELTFALLNESKDHLYWDWVPGYFIGFDYFYFIKDNIKASEYLMGASTVRDAPAPLATFAARLAQESGSNEIAIYFLEMHLMKENDQDKREMLLTRLEAHKAIDIIEKGIQDYKRIFLRNPETLQVLVDENFIDRLPLNPYGRPFVYNKDNGALKF